MTEKSKNARVTIDSNSEDTDRFGYVPPNLMRIEERGYVPPAIERPPTPMDISGSGSDSGTDSSRSSRGQPAEEQSQ